ncbi:MAG: hypothetical protein QGH47_02065 [Candidatus Woesearchaeota archaeon]|nr:hypothetical protein [Candidatus Woesearchaeota archaeon]
MGLTLRNVNILYGHGYEGRRAGGGVSVKYWKFGNGSNVARVLKEIEETGMKIDALLVCNPGGITLRPEGKYIYIKKGSPKVNVSWGKDGYVIGTITNKPGHVDFDFSCPPALSSMIKVKDDIGIKVNNK